MLKKSELIELIKQSVKTNNQFIELMRSDTNPQVVAIVNDRKGRLQAFSDVLEALQGNTIPLKMSANR